MKPPCTRSPSVLRIAALALGAAACTHPPPAPGSTSDDGLLAVGTPAPEFAMTAHDGRPVDLAKLRGSYVVLYFYPKDDTSGCTKEACDFRDSWVRLQALGVVVLGVSTQDAASHTAFAEKYHLPFPLLPDAGGALAARYHVPTTIGLAHRVTYLIDKDGTIKHVWPKVTPVGHAAEILAQVQPG
jgi:thioredoxin-dependent peroxiredoxin